MKKVASQPEPLRLCLPPSSLRCCGLRGNLVSMLSCAAIERVTHHRVTDRRHVNADLMRPAGLDAHFHQGELAETIVEAPRHLVVRDCRAGVLLGPRPREGQDQRRRDPGGQLLRTGSRPTPALMVPFSRTTVPSTSAI